MKKNRRVILTFLLAAATVAGTYSGAVCAFASEAPMLQAADQTDREDHTRAAIAYLDKHYKDGVMGTAFLYGSSADRSVLEKLSATIIGDEGNAADAAKAEIISRWMLRNIHYDADDYESPVAESAIDTFYRRDGKCFGYAQLISQLLRIEGIPAVVGVGKCSKDPCLTQEAVSEKGEGHAWVYMYDATLASWAIYDPLFDRYGITDPDEMRQFYDPEEIEGITPSTTSEGQFLTNAKITRFVTYRKSGLASDGRALVGWHVDPKSGWERYARENGLLAANDMQSQNGKEYVLNELGLALGVSADKDIHYWDGRLNLMSGTKASLEGRYQADPAAAVSYTYKSSDPEILQIGENGLATAGKAGKLILTVCALDAGGKTLAQTEFQLRVAEVFKGDPEGNAGESSWGREYDFADYPSADASDETDDTHEHDYSYGSRIEKAGMKSAGERYGICACGEEISAGIISGIQLTELTSNTFFYDKKKKQPGVIVLDTAGKVLKKGTDYKVTYPSGCKKPGTYTVTLAFKGKYKGKASLKFRILSADPENMQKKCNALSEKKDLAGASFSGLCAWAKKADSKSITLQWKRVASADRYVIYMKKCGQKGGFEKVKTISNAKTTSCTIKKYGKQKLEKGAYYKFVVIGYADEDGDDVIKSLSKSIYASTAGGRYGNSQSVSAPAKITIKKGGSKTISGKWKQEGSEGKNYRNLSYESSNKAIATVSAKGKVHGIKKGRAIIYCYAQDGRYQAVKVTVK